MAEFTENIASDYGVKNKLTTTRNPQSNSVVERIHQTISNMIRSFEVHDTNIDEKDTWTEILIAECQNATTSIPTLCVSSDAHSGQEGAMAVGNNEF
eukprot:322804-Ditylum_brightwellii.AAC.1